MKILQDLIEDSNHALKMTRIKLEAEIEILINLKDSNPRVTIAIVKHTNHIKHICERIVKLSVQIDEENKEE